MKWLTFFLFAIMGIGAANAQLNINPDPNGNPWIVGGIPEMTPENMAEIELIPKFKLNQNILTINLPMDVDNSFRPYMRDIFQQNGNSCSQAAAVGYMFTYEINRLRNIPANHDSALYHPSFTYNFLNYSCPDSGSYIYDGLRILKEMGCPNIMTYGKSIQQADSAEWITGYSKYFEAMQNRIILYETIDLPGDSGLFYLKHWLYDHNSEDTIGGLAVFAVENMDGCKYHVIAEGPYVNKSIITGCDTTHKRDAHALTIIGYNDSIRFDINNNNQIESNEIGAFKVANSWDKYWPRPLDSGYCYILYSLFFDDSAFLQDGKAYICHTKADYSPEITLHVKMTHPYRRWFFQKLGIDTIAGESTPQFSTSIFGYFESGSYPLTLTGLVAPEDTLEIGIDYTFFLDNDPSRNLGKLFFRPWTTTSYQDDGMLWYGSMIDYRWGEEFELSLSNIPDTMETEPQWRFSVDYDLIPFSIVRDTLLITNQVYRLSDTISEGSTLTFGNGHTYPELHFHNAELLIEEGSVLHLSSWSSLIAKSGTNKIIVKGDLIIEPNAIVKAEGNATLEIYFENDTLNSNFSDCTFKEIEIKGFSRSMAIDNSHLTGCHLNYSSGDLIFEDNSCSNSTLTVYHPANSSSFCSITNNKIENVANTPGYAVITIEDYPSFLIQNDSILYNFDRGIELFYAGREARGNHSIGNNVIQFAGFPFDSVAELGIHAYYSNADIYNNKIQYNDYGITGFHRSELTVLGDSLAQDIDSTQLIGDNTRSQCLFNISTFPTEFRWNVIRDVSMGDKPFIKVVEFDEMIEDTSEVKDWFGDSTFNVEYNCWVNDTNPEDRLVPVGAYTWRPAWCPGSGHLRLQNEPELMYYTALSEIENDNYPVAEYGFKQIIADYPGNKYAQASLKGLFALNPALYDTNYSFLEAYCDSLSYNPADSLLGTTAGWISIHCKIKNKQYQQAVNALDSVISDPGTLADSVFALIDLNYVYLQTIDSSNLKSSCITKNENILAKTYEYYKTNRKDWIELLFKENTAHSVDDIYSLQSEPEHQPVQFCAVYPNPAAKQVNISFEVFKQGTIELGLYSITGLQLLNLNLGDLSLGEYSKSLSLAGFPEGMYLITLSANGVICGHARLVRTK